ncbi:MAG: prepilin-type N-terminal cleavage/methylation domain-containing protein [Pirellulales bacterium]
MRHATSQLERPAHAPLATNVGPGAAADVRGSGRGRCGRRRGFTLIELLTVVSIILLLTAVTIPLAVPALAGRQKREAARELNSFIVGARSRARQTGRPVGIWLERYRDPANAMNVLDEMCLNVYYAEVPRPYAGDYVDSRIALVITGTDGSGRPLYEAQFFRTNPDGSSATRWIRSADSGLTGRLRIGDQIRVGNKGPKYTIIDAANQAQGVITSLVDIVVVDDLGQPMLETNVARDGSGNPARDNSGNLIPLPPCRSSSF